MFKAAITFLALTAVTMTAHGQSDYLDPLVPPTTVYEGDKTPQNMDFDQENNMFVAHPGWYNDRSVFYYKFRMYTPTSYSGLIEPGVGADAVPIQKIYFVSTTSDFTGVVGKPIIEHHTADGLDYSDFMAVSFVEAPGDYVEDTFKSVGDVTESGAAVTETDIVMNIPVVPTGATLQHPTKRGTEKAPIQPVPVFYKGTEVWTYVFEVNDQSAADFFADTRTDETTAEERSSTTFATGFEMPVLESYATTSAVTAIPIWHINQFWRGVTPGVNNGGPAAAGMKNIIDQDRPDAGYSPLWQVWWGTELPINYEVEQFSNADDGTSENGFEFFVSPMFVNCPNIGPTGTETNPLKETEFETDIKLGSDVDKYYVAGSHSSIIMKADIGIKFMAGDTVLGNTTTNMMGAYEYDIMKDDIPEGTDEITVVKIDDSTSLRTITVVEGEDEDEDEAPSAAPVSAWNMMMAVAVLLVPALFM